MPVSCQWSTLPRIWLKWNCPQHKTKIFCQRRSYYRVLDKLDPSLGKSEKMLTLLNSWSGQCFMSKRIWKKRNLTFWFLLFFDISVMIQGSNFLRSGRQIFCHIYLCHSPRNLSGICRYPSYTKLWNQVPSLDHLVIQNSGNFLCWKYR